MTIACGLTGADLRRNILIHYDTVRQDQTKAQKPLHGSRKLCVSHETRFRDLGCVFSCEHGVIWLSTGSLERDTRQQVFDQILYVLFKDLES